MTRRMIDSAMWSNENFAALPIMARLLQVGVINMADDQGRVKAFPAYLRSQIFPYDDVSIVDIAKWLQLIAKNGTIAIYQVEGKEYIQLLNWWDYQSLQYPAPSEYPSMPGWDDHVRYNAKGGAVLTYNYITMKGERMPDTCDSRGNPLGYSREPLAGAPGEPVSDNPPGQPTWDTHLDNPPETPGDNPSWSPNTIQDQLEDQDNTDQPNGREEEKTHARDPLTVAWEQVYQDIPMPPKLPQSLQELVTECGMAATIHGIKASAAKEDGRNFRYIAECARNYVPPPPVGSVIHRNGNGRSYHVDIPVKEVDFMPGVYPLTPPPNPSPPVFSPPMAHDDPWSVALGELLPTLSTQAAEWLKDSVLSGESELAGEPFYQVLVSHPKADMQWLKQQLEVNVRRKLRTLIGYRINVAFVHVAASTPPAPAAHANTVAVEGGAR